MQLALTRQKNLTAADWPRAREPERLAQKCGTPHVCTGNYDFSGDFPVSLLAELEQKGWQSPEKMNGENAIQCLARNIFVLTTEGGAPRYQLAGSAIRQFLNTDPFGQEYYRYWDSEAQSVLEFHFAHSIKCGRAFRISATILDLEENNIAVETALMPNFEIKTLGYRFFGLSFSSRELKFAMKPDGRQHLRHISFAGELASS